MCTAAFPDQKVRTLSQDSVHVTCLSDAMESASCFSLCVWGIWSFLPILGLPPRTHQKRSMTLEWRRKAGLDRQMLQTIKHCQNSDLQKAHSVLSLRLPLAPAWPQRHQICLGYNSWWGTSLAKSDRVFYCSITLIWWTECGLGWHNVQLWIVYYTCSIKMYSKHSSTCSALARN